MTFTQSCTFEAATCTFEVATCTFEVVTCTFESETCTFESATCTYEVETCTFEVATCTFEIETCTFEIETCTFGKSVYQPLFPRIFLQNGMLINFQRWFEHCQGFELWYCLFEQPAIISSPDSSGSPLLGIGNGDAAATADSGT